MFRPTLVGIALFLAAYASTAQVKLTALAGGFFAEGYTSPDTKTPVQLAHRMFTTSSRDCEELEGLPTQLMPLPSEIVVRVGEEFSLPTLIVRAMDSSGRVIPKTPIGASIWYETGTLSFQNDQDLQFSIAGVRAGKGGVVVQVLCTPGFQITIPIRIVPRQ